MSIDSDAHVLSALPVFNLLEWEAIRLLAFHASKKSYKSDDILFSPGQKAAGGLVLLSGSIELIPDGVEAISTYKQANKVLGHGALIGQLALITEVTHRVTAQARENSTMIEVSRTSFQRILREYPDCTARIRSAIARDLLEFTSTLSGVR